MVRPAAMKTAARREPPIENTEAPELKPVGFVDAFAVGLPVEPGVMGEE